MPRPVPLLAALLASLTLLPVARSEEPPAPSATPPPAAAKPADAAPDGQRDFRLTCRTLVPKPAPGTKTLEARVPVPYESAVQQVRELSVSAPLPYSVSVDPATGNRMVHVKVSDPSADVRIEWTAVVPRRVEEGQEAAPACTGDWLKSDRLGPVDARARAIAKQLKADAAAASVRERARRSCDHVVASTACDKVEPGWGQGDFSRVLTVNKGNCSDFTARLITLARAAGIPARWASTISLSEEHAACDACGYHCYAYFPDGGRWVPVDPSDARRAQEKNPLKTEWYFGHAERSDVILSVGRDLRLVPPQQAGPVNYLGGPYVELDGKPVQLEGKNRSYEYKALLPGAPGAWALGARALRPLPSFAQRLTPLAG